MKIYIAQPRGKTTDTFLTPKALEKIYELGEVFINNEKRQPDAELIKAQCPDAEVMIIGWGSPKYTAEFLDAMPKLKLICYMGGGVGDLVTDELSKRGIILLSGNKVFARSVAEGCLTYTLCALRRLEHYMKEARRGVWWDDDTFDNRGITGKKIGLVGFGEIARIYAEILKVFDVEVYICSKHITDEEAAKYNAKKATKDEIFSQCDVVSIHSALNDKTRGSITREDMEKLKSDALFVNTARGEIVDEKAMVELLAEKRFFAAIDVFSIEPIPVEGHFLSPILKMDNVMIIPHMGGPTLDMREQVVLELAKDIKRFKNNEALKNEALSR